MVIKIYKNKDILLGKVSLKTSPDVIVIKGSDEEQSSYEEQISDEQLLFRAVDKTMEYGYKIITAYNPNGQATRVILERA